MDVNFSSDLDYELPANRLDQIGQQFLLGNNLLGLDLKSLLAFSSSHPAPPQQYGLESKNQKKVEKKSFH